MNTPNSSQTGEELRLADVERARANRMADESAYDAWKVESPSYGLKSKQETVLERSDKDSTVETTDKETAWHEYVRQVENRLAARQIFPFFFGEAG